MKLNDYCVYPGQGVAKVVGRYPMRLEVLSNNVTVIIPDIEKSNIRPLMSIRDSVNILSFLKDECTITSASWNERYKDNVEKVKSGLPFSLALVIRELNTLNKAKELSFGERRLKENAEELLSAELAIVTCRDVESVLQDIRGLE